MAFKVVLMPSRVEVTVPGGATLLEAQRMANLNPDAPCGGGGTCGKCLITLLDGADKRQVKACQTRVTCDMTVELPCAAVEHMILENTASDFSFLPSDKRDGLAIAFDLGTTTLVGYMLDRAAGKTLATVSRLNPQAQYGADVIARASYALEHGGEALRDVIRGALNEMICEAAAEVGLSARDVNLAVIVGNTCMHHLMMGLSVKPLVFAPYLPETTAAMELPADDLLDINPLGTVRFLPLIAGFVGADTVGMMLAAGFDKIDKLTLAIDVGTNGEIVLGNRHHAAACSTAAGPAFEGARIKYGMRGAAGAIDRASISGGKVTYNVIGGVKPRGICGSGLLDIVACLLKLGIIDSSGKLEDSESLALADGMPAFPVTDEICLTQRDIREVQLAKGAIAAGICMLCAKLGVSVDDIEQVLIAGAFGNYMDPDSACAIGLIPPELSGRIVPVGNAAGEGARRAALSEDEWGRALCLAEKTEFVELAADPNFQDIFIDELAFPEV